MSMFRVALLDDAGGWREISTGAKGRARRPASILVVPGSRVLGRVIPVAGSTIPQMSAAALGMLASDLAQPSQDCVAAVGSSLEDRRLVCVAARSDVENWREIARQNGMTPDIIVPDFALLACPPAGDFVVAVRDGDTIARTCDAAFACQPEIASLLLMGLNVEERVFEDEAMRSLRSGAISSLPDFERALPARAEARARPVARARIAMAAGVALAVAAAAPWVHAMRLDGAARDFREQTDAVARTALPGAARIVNARAQLQEALLPVHDGQSLVSAAAAIVEGAAAGAGVSIAHLDADITNAVSATVAAPRIEDLEPIRLKLADQGLAAIETPGQPSGGMIVVDLTVRVQP